MLQLITKKFGSNVLKAEKRTEDCKRCKSKFSKSLENLV